MVARPPSMPIAPPKAWSLPVLAEQSTKCDSDTCVVPPKQPRPPMSYQSGTVYVAERQLVPLLPCWEGHSTPLLWWLP